MSGRILLAASTVLALTGLSGSALAADRATAELQNTEGKQVGTVELTRTPHGVLLDVQLENLPEGTHAFHIHETGKCEPPFKSAGGHFNPAGKDHGIKDEGGMHAGDLPNIHVPDGSLRLEVLADAVTLDKGKKNSLVGDDGSAIVIHEGTDDYSTDPAGDAGNRIACGVIEPEES